MSLKWKDEYKEFLIKEIPGKSEKEIIELFKQKFDITLRLSQISYFKNKYHIKSGTEGGRFKKGQAPANKGTKGLMKPNKTSFKKGNIPPNHRPVGSERINVYGYVEKKVAERNKWKLKHVIVWEEVNGKMPKSCCLIFIDNNKQNCALNNLMLVTRKVLVRLNQMKLSRGNIEIVKSSVLIAKIKNKVGERKRKHAKK